MIWEHKYLPKKVNFELLKPKEKEIVDTLLEDFSLDKLMEDMRKEKNNGKNIERVRVFGYQCAI